MKKTIAVIGSAAALSFAGAGLAAAEEADDPTQGADTTQTETTEDALDDALDEVETPAEVSDIAAQLCGTISAYDFLGSAEGVVPGLSGEACEANATAAVAAAFSGDISGAIDILRGIDAEIPGDDDETADAGSAELLGSLAGGDAEGDETADDTELPAFGS
ncbi:hypothetical protein BFG51_14070 [Dietzia alimentaria]|uniref:hypothetical protein n=2 Tax=Dietziaceae TaxID=85029 RepID=UPI0008485AE3|nr:MULTISPECIES: hypothetical protein [Dietzia]MCZ4541218.1 hypothetical protein [Dietzia maris]MCZ4657136.1 hypothetical protein [Dietzia kunjamensis]ODQ94474.1 hypothetical protein BFG51_14070 [Dietzia alimentaria]